MTEKTESAVVKEAPEETQETPMPEGAKEASQSALGQSQLGSWNAKDSNPTYFEVPTANVDSGDLARLLSGNFGEGGAQKLDKSLRYMYFKSCPSASCVIHSNNDGFNKHAGWIKTGPTSQSNIDSYTTLTTVKHYIPLPEYGTMLIGDERGHGSIPARRFFQILSAGGIHEFPISQIQAYNWDLLEPIQLARPDLPKLERIPCNRGCGRRFRSEMAFEKHTEILHSSAAGAQALADALKPMVLQLQSLQSQQAGGGGGLDMAQLSQVITTSLMAAAQSGVLGEVLGSAVSVAEAEETVEEEPQKREAGDTSGLPEIEQN